MKKEQIIKRLTFENYIWIVFIIISILDIYGDELIKKGIINNNTDPINKANKLFLGITSFSLLIYIYFLIRNYNDYCYYKNNKYKIRLLGSTLVLLGTICFLYFQVTNKDSTDSLSEE